MGAPSWLVPSRGHHLSEARFGSQRFDQLIAVSVWRRRFVVALVLVVAMLLFSRILYLYYMQGSFLRLEGDKRTVRTLSVPAHRGGIRDRNGVNLAISTSAVSIWGDPTKVPDDAQTYQILATHLGKTPAHISQLFGANRDKQFIYLARQLAPETAQALMKEQIPGINSQTEYKRFYPAGPAAAHVVGLTDLDQKGQEGIELAFDEYLTGQPGAYTIVEDLHHKMIDRVGLSTAPRPGKDIRLTIDLRFQYLGLRALEKAVKHHKAQAGTLVALDVSSGAILSMISYPSFNPNDREGLSASAIRNRAIADVFEPGSTMKPFTVLAAMDAGLYAPDTLIDTSPGYLYITGKQIKDFRNYGLLDVTQVIQKSSNVGVVKMALDLPEQSLTSWFSRLGFGLAVGVGLPGERDGVLPIWQKPKKLDLATLSFGYGLSVTALQLARAYATIASGGISKQPFLVLGQNQPLSEQVMGQGLAWEIGQMLQTVTGPGGTAQKAAIAGYHVAGKTGTVYKMTPSGYADDAYLSLFAGYAPAQAPRVAVVVLIDDPKGGEHFGGAVAAPVFAEFVGHVLRLDGVPPDAVNFSKSAVVSGKL